MDDQPRRAARAGRPQRPRGRTGPRAGRIADRQHDPRRAVHRSGPRRGRCRRSISPRPGCLRRRLGGADANKGTTEQPAATTGSTGIASDVRMSLNFRYAPWAEVLKLFAERAGLTLDLTETPPGTFNYYDKKSYTPTEALDILNGYLLQKGYILVRRDEFLVCLRLDGNPILPISSPRSSRPSSTCGAGTSS